MSLKYNQEKQNVTICYNLQQHLSKALESVKSNETQRKVGKVPPTHRLWGKIV